MTSFTEVSTMDNMPSIASYGFWASKDVPLSAGVRKVTLPKSTYAPQIIDPQVKSMCHVAQERAEVGGDIRWEVILEQAAQMPCALRACNVAVTPEPIMKKSSFDGEDCESTSGGSGSASEATSFTSAEKSSIVTSSSDPEFPNLGVLGGKKQKKKRGVAPGSNVSADAVDKLVKQPPNAPSTLCYTLPFLLQVFHAMSQAEKAAGGSPPASAEKLRPSRPERKSEPAAVAFLSSDELEVTPPPGLEGGPPANVPSKAAVGVVGAIKGGSNKGQESAAKKNAPWRRPKAAPVA